MRLAESRRWLPLLVALIAGIVTLASYVLPNPVSDSLLDIVALLVAVGLLVGIVNVANIHRRRIAGRARDWQYSIVLVVALVTTFIVALLPALGLPPASVFAQLLVDFVFQYVLQPLAVSVLALLTFFALRAAWRALQLRPREAALILGVAVIFLLASGPWAGLVPGLRETLAWIEAYLVLGVARGLLLGVGIGALVASTRLLLGFDQPYLDR